MSLSCHRSTFILRLSYELESKVLLRDIHAPPRFKVSLSTPVKLFTKNVVLLFCTVIVAGCAKNSGGSSDAIYDPNEDRNRKVHAFNVNLDKKFVRPLATEYSSTLPDVIEDSISNFASNLGQPSILGQFSFAR